MHATAGMERAFSPWSVPLAPPSTMPHRQNAERRRRKRDRSQEPQRDSRPPSRPLREHVITVLVAVVVAAVVSAASNAYFLRHYQSRIHHAAAGETVRIDDLVASNRMLALPMANMPRRDWSVQPAWKLRGLSREATEALLTETIDVPWERTALVQATVCDADGCTLRPPVALVEALSASSRSRLYNRLAEDDDNPQIYDCFHRPASMGPFSSIPGIPEAVRPLVDALTWSQNGVPSFSDLAAVCSHLPTTEARQDLMRALLARRTTDVAVRTDSRASIDRIVAGFVPAQQAGVRQRLDAARASGQRTVGIETFMPEWARMRVGTFPPPSSLHDNCFSTSMRFSDPSQALIGDSDGLSGLLYQRYREVHDDARFGDVLALRDARGRILHAANWLVGGYVFTKNGDGPVPPWRVVAVDEVLADYPATAVVETWRRR